MYKQRGWMLLVALALAILTLTGTMSAWVLLALTFLLGLGTALDVPAWQAIIPELVEREELPAAVALSATGFNSVCLLISTAGCSASCLSSD